MPIKHRENISLRLLQHSVRLVHKHPAHLQQAMLSLSLTSRNTWPWETNQLQTASIATALLIDYHNQQMKPVRQLFANKLLLHEKYAFNLGNWRFG